MRNPELGRPVSLELAVLPVRDTGDSRANPLASNHAAQPLLLHQAFDRAARPRDALPAHLLPDLRRAVDLHVGLPDTLDLRPQALITYCTGTAPRRIAKLHSMAPVARRGNPRDLADRLDPEGVALLIDEGLQDLRRRSSSAWAKNALASFRMSLARRSSLTSRSNALRRSRSAVVTPLRSPLS